MDTTDARINFDSRGYCDHCNTFYKKILPHWQADQWDDKKIYRIINDIKKQGENNDFDCIIGMSGGVDSSYLTYIAKEVFKLRPLVFHVDAGWNTQIAVTNIKKIVDKLKLDLYTEVINWNEMRDLQLAFLKSGVPHIDAPQDHAYFATMYKFAEKHNVKYILTGANYSTECIRNPIEWMYYQSDSLQLKDIHNKFGTVKLRQYPITNILKHKVILPYIKGIQLISPLNYIYYSKYDAIKVLKEKFDWEPYPQKHFESRFTRFYEGYWLIKRFGFDTRRVQFSSLILTNQMSREDALLELRHFPLDDTTVDQECAFIANKLGISVEELRSYLHAPLKSFRDYRSQDFLYKFGAIIMRLLGLVRGGKR
jgi:N-acetyl sugar amidotransferase